MRHTMGGGTSRPGAKGQSEPQEGRADVRAEPRSFDRAAHAEAQLTSVLEHLKHHSEAESGRGLWHSAQPSRKGDSWGPYPSYPQDVLHNPGYSDSGPRDYEMLLA